MTCALAARLAVAVSLTCATSPKICSLDAIEKPPSTPYDWLVTLPNVDCATPSMYPAEAGAFADAREGSAIPPGGGAVAFFIRLSPDINPTPTPCSRIP